MTQVNEPIKIDKIIDSLMYSSYEANRGYGLTHNQLVNIGIGNEEMRLKYELENNINKPIENN